MDIDGTRQAAIQANNKTIRFPAKTDEKLSRLANKLGRTKIETFIQMVDYFHACKKDPRDINDELIKNTLLRNHKDYIGFIKTQESELLVPIKKEVGRMAAFQQVVLKHFEEEVSTHNKTLLNNQQEQLKRLENQQRQLARMEEQLQTKAQLKASFLYLFNQYVKTRDSFGMMTPASEKNNLLETTLNQMRYL